ncbi:MAG: PAS domain-containing sensor histidine kinase [Terrisporobacter othiniensis]|uniref:histidine kinase n=2 Tax=Terrisporobacter TaxID=1505652 RepID=A0AAX2ZAT6_9FIRM|nr:PAS domain-containing sensor histidine kinase [Terrisporobacter hibernicus]MDU4861444.1 PAS domain-containing sensor histidine kinase [Terrisporobacter othiniensis]MDU6994607.1 PAS domain-containing sensor histidine kinase [Terrisporobacter othiniensis]UEL46293.1 PAS domain-containing sensor histidine kinase [Terrisporobacter hibernicus]SFJ59483.1 PAS domain S-box-containing protein [Terrisporobacter glycolicus]
MKKDIYRNIIRNSKIAYLIINSKKNNHNKYIGIEVLEQNKEFEKIFKLLTENNVFEKEVTELIVNNWIKNKFKGEEFDQFVNDIIKNGHKNIEYTVEINNKTVMMDIYYLEEYFIVVFSMSYNMRYDEEDFIIYNWAKDLNGVYIDVCPNCDDSKLKDKKTTTGKRDLDLWETSDVRKFRQQENNVISNRNVKTFYQTLRKKDGTKIYLESTIWPIIDDNDNIIGTRGFSVEINDKLVFEKSLEENEENFREITKYSDSVFIIRDKERATYVSPAFRNVFEDSPEDLYKDFDKLYEYFKRVEWNDQNIDYEFDECNEGTGKVKLDNGKEKWIWYKFLPIKDSKGNISKRVGILTDVTEKKKIEEEKNQLKLDFFANLSHELRTPINLISSTIQLIKLNLTKLSPQDANKFYKYMDIMEMNSLRLVRLINNLLDSTRVEAGYISFNPINADIVAFIEDICESIVEFTEFNSMHLIFDTNVEEEVVLFDQDIIERTMLNLLSNAVKFNKKNGNIYVNLYIKADKIKISVKDEGIGIPKEKANCIFERFEQVESRNRMEKQGSGIGLYLVKSLVSLHGGTINVNSEVNQGSEFIVVIPRELLNNGEELIIQKKEEVRYSRANIEFSDI